MAKQFSLEWVDVYDALPERPATEIVAMKARRLFEMNSGGQPYPWSDLSYKLQLVKVRVYLMALQNRGFPVNLL